MATAMMGALLVHGEDWGSLGYDGARTRTTPEILGTPFAPDWSVPLPSGGVSSPSVADGRIVVGTLAGETRCYSEIDGSLLWTKATGDEVIATPLVTRGRAYVPSTDRSVHVYRLSDGVEIETIADVGTAMSSPATDGVKVFLARGFPHQDVTAIGLWQTPLEQLTYSSPAVSNALVYVGCNSGRYYCLDAATGAIQYSIATDGDGLLSSPLIVNDEMYIVPGGSSSKIYGGTSWTYTVPEPAPILGGYQSTRRPVSSPVRFGDRVAFVIRFDQYHDTDGDWITDNVVMREYLVVLAFDGALEAWAPLLLSSVTVPSPEDVPQLVLCPTPAVFTSPGGPRMVVASSITTDVRIFDPSGAIVQTLAVDTPTRSSPVVANTHLYVATNATLYAFLCATNTAPLPPGGFSPAANANVLSWTPTVAWADAADPDAPLTYVLRVDDDGEVLLNWDFQIETILTSVTLPSLWGADTQLTFALRTRDADGALSAWSSTDQFWIFRNQVAPEPPSNLEATPGPSSATLTWTASPSTDIAGYWVSVDGGAYTPVGNVTSTIVGGLADGVPATLRLLARDYDNLDSPSVETIVIPGDLITIGGVGFLTLDAAAAAAIPGETIVIGPGTVTVASTVELKEGVTIEGYAPHLTKIKGPGLGTVIRVVAGAGIATIKRLSVLDGTVGVDANGLMVDLFNVILRNLTTGLLVPPGSTARAINVTAVNNSGAAFDVGAAVFKGRNCIVNDNGTGILADLAAALTLLYNNVAQNSAADYSGATPGEGSTSNAIPFLPDFREPDGSPNVDAGEPTDDFAEEPEDNGDRINQGAFGNTPWAARTAAPATGGGDSSGGGCGMLGLEALALLGILCLLRRRMKLSVH